MSSAWYTKQRKQRITLIQSLWKTTEVDTDILKQLIEEDPQLTMRHLAEQLGCSHTTLEKHLKEFGKSRRYGVRITQALSPHYL